ncbi:MAG: serine protease [Planctomycetaceae bacterium]|nr:serine protease [Planctomycetaceae bacterium]
MDYPETDHDQEVEQLQVLPRPETNPATPAPRIATSGDMALAAIKYRFARLVITTLTLLLFVFGTPYLVQQIQYSLEYGKIKARYDAASVHLSSGTNESVSRRSELVSNKVTPSVVHIHTAAFDMETRTNQRVLPESNLFPSRGQGSGIVVSADGYILTNRHVIEDSNLVYVHLADQSRYTAEIIGVDKETDLALIKIDKENLIPIQWAPRDAVQVGTMVWAMGSPFGLEQSITLGIVSATHRTAKVGTLYQDFLQTDAAVNPGNSGGPLVNENGLLIGVNTAIVGDAYQGISFAVPGYVAQSVSDQLEKNGRVSRGWLGLSLANPSLETLTLHGLAPPEGQTSLGAQVTDFAPSYSPGYAAGIEINDVILEFNGKPITSTTQFIQAIGETPGGLPAKLRLRRMVDGMSQEKTIELRLGERPLE